MNPKIGSLPPAACTALAANVSARAPSRIEASEQVARIIIEGKEYTYPVIIGTENEKAIDTRKLRSETGYITYDDGYGNTGSCLSKITYIDGEKGILQHRGIPIEQLAGKSTFLDTAYLIIYGDLPNPAKLDAFRARLDELAIGPVAVHASYLVNLAGPDDELHAL